MSERDEMRFKLEDEQQRLQRQLREQDSKFGQLASEARHAEEDLIRKVEKVRQELRSAEERANNAEAQLSVAEHANHSAMMNVRNNEVHKHEIGTVIENRQLEIEALRSRLSAAEAIRHDEAMAAEGRIRELQSDITNVEFAAKEEIRRLDTELTSARTALHAAEQMVLNDASTYTNELTLRVTQVERERDEERRVAAAEIRRLNEELKAAAAHIERLNRELAGCGDRAVRQHDGDRREVNELLSRLRALQKENEIIGGESKRKVTELAETLLIAKAEIARLDKELRATRPYRSP